MSQATQGRVTLTKISTEVSTKSNGKPFQKGVGSVTFIGKDGQSHTSPCMWTRTLSDENSQRIVASDLGSTFDCLLSKQDNLIFAEVTFKVICNADALNAL